MNNDIPERERKLSDLSLIDYNDLSEGQLKLLLIHLAERQHVAILAEEELIKRLAPMLTAAQMPIFAKFIEVMNDIDMASFDQVEKIVSGAIPGVQ